jgi:hypothetical protein
MLRDSEPDASGESADSKKLRESRLGKSDRKTVGTAFSHSF